MAEILIQRKRRRSVWPWLLGLGFMALLPLAFLNDPGGRARAAPVARRDTTTRTVGSAVDTSARQVPGAGIAAAPGAPSAAAAGRAPGRGGVTGQPAASPSAAGPTATTRVAAGGSAARQDAGTERTTATSAGTIAPTEPPPAPRVTGGNASGARTTGASSAASPGTTTSGPASDRASFSRFTATTRAPTNERAHREYTADALDRLAAELRALGATEAGVSVIRTHADSLRMTIARNAARPDYARAAFLGAVHQFDLLRDRNRARVNVARLRSAAWAIDPRRSLVAQRAAVERFFAAARDALDSLSRRG